MSNQQENADVDAIVQSFVSDELASLEQAGSGTDKLQLSSKYVEQSKLSYKDTSSRLGGPGAGSSLTGPALRGQTSASSSSLSSTAQTTLSSPRASRQQSIGDTTKTHQSHPSISSVGSQSTEGARKASIGDRFKTFGKRLASGNKN